MDSKSAIQLIATTSSPTDVSGSQHRLAETEGCEGQDEFLILGQQLDTEPSQFRTFGECGNDQPSNDIPCPALPFTSFLGYDYPKQGGPWSM